LAGNQGSAGEIDELAPSVPRHEYPQDKVMSRSSALQVAPGQVFRRLVDDLGLDDKDLRVIFDAEQRSIEKWMSGETLPQKPTRRRLNELAALHAHLGETFTSYEGARAWMRAPLRYLAGLTPLQVLRAGDSEHTSSVELLEEALEALDSGAFL
jgi:hypothetical protein